MKKKKLTYNELNERLDFVFNRLMEVERAVNYIHTLTVSYISSNNHQDKFKKYLEKESKKNEQANGSDSKGNRENKSGNSNADSKSK